MDLYRVYVCLTPEDEVIAAAAHRFEAAALKCLHLPLPSANSHLCCRPRRIFHKRLRCYLRESVPPRETRDFKLPASFWNSSKELIIPSFPNNRNPVLATEIIFEAAVQLHRLLDYFNAEDVGKCVEVVCCLSEASAGFTEFDSADCLMSALLRTVEFQDGRVVLAAAEALLDLDPPAVSTWGRQANAQLLCISPDGCARWAEAPQLPSIWRGGVRFPCAEGATRTVTRIPGLQLLHERNDREGEEVTDFAVPVAAGKWLEIVRPADGADFCPLLPAQHRFTLCLQSSCCEFAAKFLHYLRRTGGLFCRLPLFPAQAEVPTEQGDQGKLFVPASDRWLPQLLNDLRSDLSPNSSSFTVLQPSPTPILCLSFLLLPSSNFPGEVEPLLQPCDAILLRQSWQLPLPLLQRALSCARESVSEELSAYRTEAVEAALAELCDSPTKEARASSVSSDWSAASARDLHVELGERLRTHVQGRSCLRKSEGMTPLLQLQLRDTCGEREENSADSRFRKDSESSDHLVDQILRSFTPDGLPAVSAVDVVKPRHRSIIDKVDDPSQLQWPQAANIFYHGIDYNRGPWCEQRAERLAALQREAIPQETMCTVTRCGCRGNVASSKSSSEPRVLKLEKNRILKPSVQSNRQEAKESSRRKSQKTLTRSQRHDEMLRSVVSAVLAAEGVDHATLGFAVLSKNLFAATRTMIQLQKLPNSRNLREKMEAAARLQYQVLKQLSVD